MDFRAGVTADSEVTQIRRKLQDSKLKIEFFTTLCGVVKRAGIGLPAKSRAPAQVAGWAPRISQTPRFGARLAYLRNE